MPKAINYVLNVFAMVTVTVSNIYLQRYVDVCTTILLLQPEVLIYRPIWYIFCCHNSGELHM